MDLSVYVRPRAFQQPYSKVSRAVGIQSVLWVLMLGPIYYWKQGAMIEAILLSLASIPLLFVDESSSYVSVPVLSALTTFVWAAAAILAPVLLALSYQRRGWVEIAPLQLTDCDCSRE